MTVMITTKTRPTDACPDRLADDGETAPVVEVEVVEVVVIDPPPRVRRVAWEHHDDTPTANWCG